MPEQVRYTGGDCLNQHVADTTLTAIRFSGGVRAYIFVSWLNPFKEQKMTVVGSSGLVVFNDTQPWKEKLIVYRQYTLHAPMASTTPSNVEGAAVVPPESEPLRNEWQHFVDCCRDRRGPRADGRDGLRGLSIVQAALRSLDADGDAVDPTTLLQPLSSKSQHAIGLSHSTAQAPALVPSAECYIHPTAVVDEGAVIGKGTKIWHFCHVMKGAKIGERCVFGQNVNIDGGTVIGNNVKVQNNVSIYTGLALEDDVFLGRSCVLTDVTNPRAQVNRHSRDEKTLIRRGATIGANTTILHGVTIGRHAFVGAGTVVTRGVPDYALVFGNPARHQGWISRHGHILKLGENGVLTCPEPGFRYREIDGNGLRGLDLGEDQPLPPDSSRGVKGYDEFKQPSC